MAKTNLIIGSILILFFVNIANAAEDSYSIFRYDCKARFSVNESVILQLEIPDQVNEDGYAEAEIALHGEIMKTYFKRDGLEKVWFLQVDDDLMIVLDAELNATYYDHRSNASSTRTLFECRKVENKK